MERYFFIVNPISGSGRARAEFEKVRALLDARGVTYEVAYTQCPGHAKTLAEEALAAGYRRVVAVGGDGTVNEAASALVHTDAALAVLPFGTGNDLTRVVRFPAEPEKAVETLLEDNVVRMDAGEANGLIFVNVAGLGFDVDVLVKTLKYKKKHPRGMTPYLLGILDALSHLRTLHLTIEHDGERVKTEGIILSVGNGQYIGGGMRAVPMGDPFDGYLDCVYVQKVGVPRFLALLPGFLKGKHIKAPVVHHFRTRELRVETEEECVLDYDGDLRSSASAVFRVLPGALNVVLPREEAR
ncbi:MAG TPA: diacylglycerol kinase family protein [Clostridia bacterium]|nr:diacylglycerol kinase family protein [Clostridia bacterium]